MHVDKTWIMPMIGGCEGFGRDAVRVLIIAAMLHFFNTGVNCAFCVSAGGA